MTERDDNLLRGIDRSRELPQDLRARLEAELAGGVATAVLPPGIDRPRAIPPDVRNRLEAAVLVQARSLVGNAPASRSAAPRAWYRSGKARQWVPLVAAVLVLFVAISGALTLNRDRAGRPVSDALSQFEAASDGPRLGETTTTGAGSVGGSGPAPPFSASSATAGASTIQAAPGNQAAAPAPDSAAPESAADFSEGSSARSAQPIRVALSGSDGDVAEGFRAYLDALNAQGGVGGSRRVEAVGAGESGLMATVSTSLEGPLDPRSSGPRLEGPAAEEGRLRDDNFSFAAAPERLGHLLADALYPQASPGDSVVIFTGSGVFAQVVPAAIEGALREKGVVATRVPTRSGRPDRWAEGDAVVLSMSAADARQWLAAADGREYSMPRGVAGIWNLADPSSAGLLPEGSTVVTPYATPRADEADAMFKAAGEPPPIGFVHGWASAKALSIALWQSGASTPQELTAALEAFPQDDLGGLIPPYRVRSGTHSRTPEGIVLEVRRGSFVANGGFRTDPRT